MELKSQAGEMAQRQVEARSQVDALDKKVSAFVTQCDGRLNKLDQSLAEQAVALTTSTKAMQEQFKTFGQDLMTQIIKLRSVPSLPNKKRRGEEGVEEDAAP